MSNKVVEIRPGGNAPAVDLVIGVLEERAEEICGSVVHELYKDRKDKPGIMVLSSETKPVGPRKERHRLYSTDTKILVDGVNLSLHVGWEIKRVNVIASYVFWGVVLSKAITGTVTLRFKEDQAQVDQQIYA